MAIKEKRKKKNAAGFFDYQLKLLLNYCYAVRQDPKIPISEIHKNYSPYERTISTTNTIRKAIDGNVIAGPFLFANTGIEILLSQDIDNPRKFYEECKKDKNVNLAVLSHGHWPIFICKQGANTLQYHSSILPSNGFNFDKKRDENIFFEEKGILPVDQYPHKWFENHWKTYHCLKSPRKKSFREAGKELGFSWETAREYFIDVLKQCKIVTTFYPLGLESYSPLLLTFKTDYETGIVKGLKTLDRTTLLYKANNTIILIAGTPPVPKAQNHFSNRFQRFEEMGLISDLHISTPLKSHRAY